MDKEQHDRGLALRRQIFGDEVVKRRMAAFGEVGAPLQEMINGYIYGDVWSRGGLPMKSMSLVMIGITAAANRPKELRVQMRGALNNGVTMEEIQQVLLLVTMYCGFTAGNEAFEAAHEVLSAAKPTG
jgi:4-carboxymuconolactone decarboxylase